MSSVRSSSPLKLRERVSHLFRRDASAARETALVGVASGGHEGEEFPTLSSTEIRLDEMTLLNTLKNQQILSREQEMVLKVTQELRGLDAPIAKRPVAKSCDGTLQYCLNSHWCLWSNIDLHLDTPGAGDKSPVPTSTTTLQQVFNTRLELDKAIQTCSLVLEKDASPQVVEVHLFNKAVDLPFELEGLALKVPGSIGVSAIEQLMELVCDDRLFRYADIDWYWLKLTMSGITLSQTRRAHDDVYWVIKLWFKTNGVIDEFDDELIKRVCYLLYYSCDCLTVQVISKLMYTKDAFVYRSVWN